MKYSISLFLFLFVQYALADIEPNNNKTNAEKINYGLITGQVDSQLSPGVDPVDIYYIESSFDQDITFILEKGDGLSIIVYDNDVNDAITKYDPSSSSLLGDAEMCTSPVVFYCPNQNMYVDRESLEIKPCHFNTNECTLCV